MGRFIATMMIFATSLCRSFVAEKGPYVSILHNITGCTTSLQPWFRYNVTVCPSHGENLLCGAFALDREIKDPKFHVTLDSSIRGKVFDIKNQNCHHIVVRLVLRFLNVRYNNQNCSFKKTKVKFTNISLELLLHTLVQKLTYGQLHLRYEMFTSSTSSVPFVCNDIHLVIQARNKSNLHP